jgi:hypothetical protein
MSLFLHLAKEDLSAQKASPMQLWTRVLPRGEHSANTLFIKELHLYFAPRLQGKNTALRALTSLRDDLLDTTIQDRKESFIRKQTMPLSTLKRQHLFIAVLSLNTSYNKGFGNIGKMGKCVKRKAAGLRKNIFREQKNY